MLKNVCIGLCLFYCFNVNGQLINNMPVKKRFDSLELVKVSPQYNESDYLALMKSKAFIHQLLNNDTWPGDHLTQEQNLATLINDLNQFDAGENFTFHIFDASDQIIGCI